MFIQPQHHDHTQASTRILTQNYSRAVTRSVLSNHSRAVTRSLTGNHSRAPVPGQLLPTTIEAPAGPGAAARLPAMNSEPAAAILGDAGPLAGDEDLLLLWCQAQERQAGLERLAGDFGAATARLRAVLDAASAAFGEASMPVVSAASALGVIVKYAADFDAAEAAYRRTALDGLEDPDPLIRAGLLHNLGGLAHSRGNAAAGIPLAETGAALRAAGLGAGHPDVARDLNALGALYHLAGRYQDAATAYRRALAVFEDSYGLGHFEVAMTCANLAVLHGDQGHHQDAESLGRRSLQILQAVLGPEDGEVGLTLLNLAAAVAGQGRRAEAAALATRAAAILTARLPTGHPHTLAAGETLERLGRAS